MALLGVVIITGASGTLHLHEFFSRLRPEFEVVRSLLLTRRPRPSLDEAMRLPELPFCAMLLLSHHRLRPPSPSVAIVARVAHRGCLSKEAA